MDNNSKCFLDISALSLSFKDQSGKVFKVLDSLALKLVAGDGLLIRGPSGSGKSSLIYLLSGLLRPDKGNVKWDEKDIWKLNEGERDIWRRKTLGIVFQDFHLLNELSPLDNVLLPATFSYCRTPAQLRESAKNLLDKFQVTTNRKTVSELSRGEKQRVAIARALLFDPPVLIADEPTASLDKKTGEAVASLLIDIENKRRKNLIVVSHDLIFQDQLTLQLTLNRDNSFEIKM